MKTLSELRKSKKLTIKEVAKRVNTSENYICMIENNRRNPSDKLKFKLAEVYGVSPATIFLATNITKC